MKQVSKPYKKLYRSRRERMLAGVCGGLAQYFEIDPTWMRLIFILFFSLEGPRCWLMLFYGFWCPWNLKLGIN
ncbi:putative stress-responsive transcriptional regulator [Legionella oakridgensis ATCC 33761 = DSM 21215]|uniref:Putative stress-responsive transcriptional regulator n=1 Tax=Legionella oakridgensis ATCC 33761 = DSM 21215 TaxID=1268635 RepID=W0BE22_9GAMM|nr:PspC domain-containing protein [Legionella oakridgensis]AHE66951.1 putative stress-responsive transcriptional regulator [Legionella oakridgensis ATCC 33761 = DSM 21215]